MGFKHEKILAFLKGYFKSHSGCGQDPKTQRPIEKYFVTELEFIPYLYRRKPSSSRKEFLKITTHRVGTGNCFG